MKDTVGTERLSETGRLEQWLFAHRYLGILRHSLRPGQERHLVFRLEELVDGVVDDLQIIAPLVAAFPLAAEDRRRGDVRDGVRWRS
jgi:hypothetical protein